MIVNYEWKNSKVLVSYIDKKGRLKFKNYPMPNPMNWEVTTEDDIAKSDKLRTWDRKPVKQVLTRYPSRYSLYEFFHDLPKEEKDDIFAYNEPRVTFCDIEVEITQGFPEAHLADNKVTAICLIQGDKILLLGIKELSDNKITKMEKDINKYFEDFNTKYKIKWVFYDTEKEMLSELFNDIIPSMPVITGWNFVKYDWVYLVTRARKLGINPEIASPTGKLVKPWRKQDADKDYKPIYEELPDHRVIVDYMDVYKKWDYSVTIKESDRLDYVAEQMLGVKKLEFDGSLKELYHDNYYEYMLYNCIDTALVQLIHNKSRLFDIMLSISNVANIEILKAMSAVRVTEGIFFKPYYDNGIIMCKESKQQYVIGNADEDDEEDEAEKILKGGYVKYPSVGIFMWIVVFDFSSLYPTTMRQFNIGPEVFKGIKISDTESLLNGLKMQLHPKDIVLNNGAVFSHEEGITTQKLTSIFGDRRENQSIGLDYKNQEVLLQHYLQRRKGIS